MAHDLTMEARVGRGNQRYAQDGSNARLVAGVVAVSADKKKVLVVESTNRKNHYVLPKGGYEMDEPTPECAATREAWEEAGIKGKITTDLGVIRDPAGKKKDGRKPRPPTIYYFFEFTVETEEEKWPEMHKRKRRWMTYADAADCFAQMQRPELKEALDRSSVSR